ncbi:putative coatamer subunit protein [Phaeoacremonium minimum UCRPA7]|uniref:Putative coatamer subunit protein n=1 Tax=Phaeoacremonium minimum (strain UCR-PA7) TaxID=1286976 RepID=R8BWG9_PHAM7|nr:putative coatamer subunit protein [Phaeoacremonium minimum UCRPA7]EOO03680.1 putative coatamer subunit protein [Phaeoacremonium minimum UCRPA7]
MSSSKQIAEFPNVEAKLQKPTKQSAYERQKAEAEAKRQREAAETAAVYEDFVKSFDHDEDDGDGGLYGGRSQQRLYNDEPAQRLGAFGGQPGGGSGRRHFGISSGSSGLKSGPGSLGPPPSSFNKKRTFDGFQSGIRRDREDVGGRLGYDDHDSSSLSVSKAFNASDDEDEQTAVGRAEEKAIAKPTLRLSNLPPGTSPAVVKSLIPSNLTVEGVKVLPPAVLVGNERKSIAAIVTLSKETAATEIDAAVSALQNRYLGFGFYLSLHRHLSSAAISSSNLTSLTSSTATSQPFGAKPVAQAPGGPGGPGGPGNFGPGRFAPPTSYGPGPGGPMNRSTLLHVPIQPPRDIKQLRMIHKVIESILEHGPEFEALLMSRPDVQRQEKWAWIWDARSQGGIWYRYRLWEIITGLQTKRSQAKYLPLFEGSHAWKVPEQPLPYEYATGVHEFVSDSEYNSSDDDEYDDEPNKHGEPVPGAKEPEEMFLNPIEKAKIVHLLARLPTTLAKIRKGDIARITTFAITHASRGADEIVDTIVSNIERPLAYTSANPDYKGDKEDQEDESPAPEDKPTSDAVDNSAATLLGLYVVSDILSSSSTSGIRHAWRYRQLFESALRNRKVFENLGLMAEKMNWGRLRAEKWKRSVGLILSLWEGWCVFPNDTQEAFVNSFEHPPSQKKEEVAEDEPKKGGGRWKTVDAAPALPIKDSGFRPVAADASGTPELEDNEDYEEYLDDEDEDDELLDQFDIDGESLLEIDIVGLSVGEDTEMGGTEGDTKAIVVKAAGGLQVGSSSTAPSRKRLRAADMFADSDSGGD